MWTLYRLKFNLKKSKEKINGIPRGVGWGGRWEGGSRGKEHMYTYG